MDDVVIIGGGIIGAASAYFLSKEGRKVKVIERDPTYKNASFPLSLGGFRRQFFQKENILLGKFAREFIYQIPELLKTDKNPNPTASMVPNGYLLMFGPEHAEELADRVGGFQSHVNLIAYNPIEEEEFQLLVSSLMLGSSAHEAGFKMKLQSMFTNYDSDGDGSADCADDDCAEAASCIEICDNGVDDNGDGDVDGDDIQCSELEFAGDIMVSLHAMDGSCRFDVHLARTLLVGRVFLSLLSCIENTWGRNDNHCQSVS